MLSTLALYISYFLKKNRVEYYDRMTEVRATGNYEQWVAFFLRTILEYAEDAISTIDKVIALHDKNVALISSVGRATKNVLLVFEYLEANPIIEIGKTVEALSIIFNTASNAIKRLFNAKILKRQQTQAEIELLLMMTICASCAKALNIPNIQICVRLFN